MTTFESLAAAREYAANQPKAKTIALVELDDGREMFVLAIVPFAAIQQMHRQRPAKGVRRFIREAANLASERTTRYRADRERYLADREKRIPGLAALETAQAAESEYQDRFARMMEDENNDGVHPVGRPQGPTASELAAAHPVAALYLRCRAAAGSEHPEKAAAFRAAQEEIEQGVSLAQAQAAYARADRAWGLAAAAAVQRS